MVPQLTHLPYKILQQLLLLQCLFWQQYFVILREKKINTFLSLWDNSDLGMIRHRKWSQVC